MASPAPAGLAFHPSDPGERHSETPAVLQGRRPVVNGPVLRDRLIAEGMLVSHPAEAVRLERFRLLTAPAWRLDEIGIALAAARIAHERGGRAGEVVGQADPRVAARLRDLLGAKAA